MSVRLDHDSFDVEGQCPICWNNILDYWDSGIDDWYVYYEWKCHKCKSEWAERHVIEFSSNQVNWDGIQKKNTSDADRERDKATRENGN